MQAHNTAYLIGVLIGATFVGGLCGLLPLLVGRSKNQMVLGGIGLVCCIIGGLILGVILAAPIAVVFTVIILAIGSGAKR